MFKYVVKLYSPVLESMFPKAKHTHLKEPDWL